MSTRAAHRYAKAILELAVQQKQETKVYDDMKVISETLSSSADLEQVLKSPVLKYADKLKAVETVFAKHTGDITKKLFTLLADNKRLDLLSIIASQYAKLYHDYKGVVKATVTSALPLDDAMTKKVLAKAKAIVGDKQVELEAKVDETLIGGFILRVGDVQMDTSIANQLRKLKRELVEQ